MKKGFVFILAFFLIIAGCTPHDYSNWKELTIETCGLLKIPQEWMSYKEDGIIYVVDKDNKPIMIETHSYAGFEENDHGDIESNDFFQDIKCLRLLSSTVLSNSASYGRVLVEKDGSQSQQFFLWLNGEPSITFIIWDKTVDQSLVKQIAASFVIAQ